MCPEVPVETVMDMLTRPMILMMAASIGGLLGFFLLFSTVPLYAVSGGSGEAGAGLVTGAMMLATVLMEPVVPWLRSRYGSRAAVALALLMLGLPTLALPLSAGLPPLMAVSALRGGGLGILVVMGTVLVAELAPPGRRGEALGLYGVATGIPSIIGLPVGLWAAGEFGFAPVLIVAGLVPLAGLVAIIGLPDIERVPAAARRAAQAASRRAGGPAAGGTGGLIGLTLLFAATTLAIGAMATFLPLAGSPELAAVALLTQSAVSPPARWWAGRYGDRHGSARLLVPGVLAAASGIALQVMTGDPVAVIAGMALFGAGFGVLQNATLALMLERGAAGRVSAVWNLAYDAGMGAGALGLGLIVGHTGYPLAFAAVALLLAATLPLTRLRKPRAHTPDAPQADFDLPRIGEDEPLCGQV
jgi:MFS family permease